MSPITITPRFKPEYQLPGEGTTNGWWNPEGDHRFKLNCNVTAAYYSDGSVVPSKSRAGAAARRALWLFGEIGRFQEEMRCGDRSVFSSYF
jgi:hypothetical protein